MITTFFTDLGTGLASFATSFATTLLELFTSLFIVEGTSGAITLTPLAQIAVAFIAIGMVYKLARWAMSAIRLRTSGRSRRKRAK